MAENENGQDKSHDPSEKRLREAAEKGDIAKSQELNSLVTLTMGTCTLVFAHGPLAEAFRAVCTSAFQVPKNVKMDLQEATILMNNLLSWTATACMVPLGAIFVGAMLIGVLQTKAKLSPKALEWKLDKLNIVSGTKELFFSSKPWMELVKGVGKLVALSIVTWLAINSRLHELPAMASLETSQLLSEMISLAFKIFVYAVPLLIVIAAADYAYSWWRNNEKLKMTLQEVKDERKEMEGDPMVRATRRARYREFSLGNMLSRIRDADVLVTNPTHYAVALRYNKDEAPAPVILAMGVDHSALKMRQEARRHDVMQIENRPLARALYATGKLGQIIPDELYGPVAQVLAIVYKRRMRARMRRGLPPQQPNAGN